MKFAVFKHNNVTIKSGKEILLENVDLPTTCFTLPSQPCMHVYLFNNIHDQSSH